MAYQGSILPYTLVKPTLAFCQGSVPATGTDLHKAKHNFFNRDPKWSSIDFWPQRLTLTFYMALTFHCDFNRSENRTENPSLSAWISYSDSDPLGPRMWSPTLPGFAPWRWPFLWSFCPVITIEWGEEFDAFCTLEIVSSFLDWSTSIHVYSLQSFLRHLAETILYSFRTVCLATKK